MKNLKLFLAIFLLPLFVAAQDGQLIKFGGSRPQDTAHAARSLRFDSVMRAVYYATSDTNKVLGINAQGFLVLRTKGNGSGSAFDTNVLNLTARFNEKQNVLGYTPYDAANPAGYISSVPAQSFSSLTGKPTTLLGYGITDAYPLSGNPSGFLTSYTETDPTFDTKLAAKSTSDLAEGTNKYYTDAKVQAVIDADTGRGVSNLATGGTLNKVKDSLAALIGGGGVVVASAAELNTGTDNTKFASALAIQGSKYLDQGGSKIAALTTGTATAYVLNTTPSFTPGTWTMLNVKFHVANTGAATINVNGSGAVALQKDLSTALVANDIPINSEYQLLRTSTGWLVKDIGLAGVTTGTGLPVRQTSASLITPALGVATATSINKVAFTSPATAATLTLANGSTLATAGAFSTTLTATATTNITLPTTGTVATLAGTENLTNKSFPSLSSGTTNDSILVADAATGAVRRISSARISSGGGGLSGLTTNNVPKATSSSTIGTSQITDNGTSVGINNASPLADCKLQVTTSTPFSTNGGDLRIDNSSSDAASITLNSTGGGGQRYSIFSASGAFGATGSFGIFDHTSGIRLLKANGAQDIGTFHVRGNNAGASSITIENTATGGTAWSLLTNANSSGRGGEFNLFNGAYRMTVTANGQVSVGSATPTTSAMLHVQSTSRGALICDMTSAQMSAIPTPVAGLQVYDTDIKRQRNYDGAAYRYSPNVYTGTAAPATTPLAVGDLFVDTTGKKIYCATGTASSADWTILN